jgi:hypothetical protein
MIVETRRNHKYEENVMKRVAKTMSTFKIRDKSCCLVEEIPLSTEAAGGRIPTIAADRDS